jgi:hypothetical protein
VGLVVVVVVDDESLTCGADRYRHSAHQRQPLRELQAQSVLRSVPLLVPHATTVLAGRCGLVGNVARTAHTDDGSAAEAAVDGHMHSTKRTAQGEGEKKALETVAAVTPSDGKRQR